MYHFFISWLFISAGFLFASDWEQAVEWAFSNKSGNTDLNTFSFTLSSEHKGDLKLGTWTLLDTEVRVTLGHSRGTLNNALFENDGNASFLLDYHANQTFSPFFLFYFEFDSTTSLNNRSQMGLGAKYRITKPFSISIAGLWELEDYIGKERVKQFRWSIRPKYKKSFHSGISINYVVFYKPIQNDFGNYLLEHYATISLATKISWFSVNLTWADKYNSRPPTYTTKKRDVDVSFGITLTF